MSALVDELRAGVFNKRGAYPKDAVYIGRGSPYGNPFIIGVHGGRDEVIRRYECEVLPNLDIEPLRGKNLVCYCAPLRCHGDSILAALSPARTEEGKP
jgi:hypothetical protein